MLLEKEFNLDFYLSAFSFSWILTIQPDSIISK